ncbi:MAG: lipopolysaccharide biosynthesis protein [Nitrospirae bacterium]|nr:lipopolysaccharide biosynthesis protein [Nitrospirota bacterium]
MENQPQEMDVRRYLQIIHAKRYLFVLVTAGIISLITAASYVVPRSYEASATVSIEKNYLNVLMQDIAVTPSIEERGHALSVVMMSRGMLLRVLSDLKVEVGSKSEAEIEKIIKRFQTKTQIKIDINRSSRKDMELFTVSYRDNEPQFARDYVNMLINRYIVDSLSSKRQEAIGANRFVFSQMDLYKDKIDRTEEELARRRREQGVQLATQLPLLQKKYEELLVQYTEQHPEVVRVRSEIEAAREQMQMQARQDQRPTGAEKMREKQPKARATAESRKSTADLERDREAYKKIYESLVASIGRAEMSSKVETQANSDTFRILDPAVLPIEPVGAPRWKIILLGILAGIAGGAGIVIVMNMMDRSIKDLETLKGFGLPVIGVIPRIQSVKAILSSRRKDRLLYGAAGMYLAGIAALAVVELLK